MLSYEEAKAMQNLLNMRQTDKARMLNNLDLCRDMADDPETLTQEQCFAIGELIDSYIDLINLAAQMASELDEEGWSHK